MNRSTLQAARRSLGPLLYAQVKELQGSRLEAKDFEALLVQDPIQDLLIWLNAPEAEQALWEPAHWETFCARCQKDFGFHPEQDGPLAAAEKLIAAKDKKWKQVWERFQQVWRNYPQIPALLEKTRKPHGLPGLSNHPAENKEAEGRLRAELKACAQKSEEDAAKLIRQLKKQHGHRRDWLWAVMDRAPLAQTLLDTTRFRRLMRENGWQILGQSDLGDPSGKGWAEAGDLDHFGHTQGRRLSRDIPNQLQFVQEFLQQLFDAGWKKVRVVTDHGWLLLQGGLPKAELSSHVTETKWGRCALLKQTAPRI